MSCLCQLKDGVSDRLSRRDDCAVFFNSACLFLLFGVSVGLLAGLNGPEITVTHTYIATTCNFTSSTVGQQYATTQTCPGCSSFIGLMCATISAQIENLSPIACANHTGPCPPQQNYCDGGYYCCLQ